MTQLPPATTYLEAIGMMDPDTAYWAVDEQQRIIYWSEGATRLLGYRSEEVLGQHCSFAVTCLQCARTCGLIKYGKVRSVALTHYHKDGHEVYTTKSVQILRDAQGNFLGGVEILRPARREVATRPVNDFHGMITGDRNLLALLTSLRKVAHTDVNVLVRGETGTGKEMVARAIHEMSPRRKREFMAINCGTLSRELMASEIFGHKRGAFTGAVSDKQGLLARAEGGTLFLDEVAELPMDVQSMLLRVIQERLYRPLGDTRDYKTDIRIISATHRSLREAVASGSFREDLMYRLRVVPIFLPPLRERKGDVTLLMQHNLARFSKSMKVPPPHLSPDVQAQLENHSWPGNIRELINLAEYLTVTRSGQEVLTGHLLPEFRELSTVCASHVEAPQPVAEPVESSLKKPARVGRKLDRDVIEQALADANGSLDVAAAQLGVSRITLWRWRKKLGLV